MRKLAAGFVSLVLALAVTAGLAQAHNNPAFAEVLLKKVEIAAGNAGGNASEPFTLDLPERSAELVWKVVGDDGGQVRFSLSVDGELVGSDLQSGSRSRLFRGKTFTVVDVKSDGPVTIEVYASVIQKAEASAPTAPSQ